MEKRYAEDFKKGDIFDLGEYAFSEDEIIDFAKKYDLEIKTVVRPNDKDENFKVSTGKIIFSNKRASSKFEKALIEFGF